MNLYSLRVYIVTIFIFTVVLLRYYAMFSTDQLGAVDLAIDEAQYLFWSQNLNFGYYSKPPFIAWILSLPSTFCNEIGPCLRTIQPIAFLFTTLFSGACTYELTKDIKATALTCISFIILPLSSFYSQFATTDAWLLFFWSFSLYCFIKSIKTHKLFWWLILGVSVGFGLLTKYSMIFFIVSSFLFLLISRQIRFAGPWISLLVIIIVFSPNIFWNFSNDFPTLKHHVEMTTLNNSLLIRPYSFVEFFVGQFLVFSPFIFTLFLFICLHVFTKKRNCFSKSVFLTNNSNKLLKFQLPIIFSLPFFFSILCLSLIGETELNWCSPVAISVCILVCSCLNDKDIFKSIIVQKITTTLFTLSILFNLLFFLSFTNGPKIVKYLGFQENPKFNPFLQVKGYKELATTIAPIVNQENPIIVSNHRGILANLSIYFPSITVKSINEHKTINHHWDLMYRINDDDLNKKLLIILVEENKNYLKSNSIALFKKKFNYIKETKFSNIYLEGKKNKKVISFWASNKKNFNP